LLATRWIVQQRKAVVLTSRVHPGETNASWMMKGFLDFLLGGSKEAKVSAAYTVPIIGVFISKKSKTIYKAPLVT